MSKKQRSVGGILGLGLGLLSVCNGSHARADGHFPTLTAGVSEYLYTIFDYHYSTNSMAQVKHKLFQNDGFNSISVAIRLGIGPDGSNVYAAPYGSKIEHFKSLITRVKQGRGGITLRPLIVEVLAAPETVRLNKVEVTEPSAFFSSYWGRLASYFEIAGKGGVTEVVLGVGLKGLWNSEHSDHWLNIARGARRSVGEKVRLSLELTSNEDLEAWESWREKRPGKFSSFLSLVNRIRISGSSPAWVEEVMPRVRALFPDLEITLAEITIPPCTNPVWNEDSAVCPDVGPWTDALAKEQAIRLHDWMKWCSEFQTRVGVSLSELDFHYATTEAEPDPGKEDHRLLTFNSHIGKMFKRIHEEKSILTFDRVENKPVVVPPPVPSGDAVPVRPPSSSPSNGSSSDPSTWDFFDFSDIGNGSDE